MANDTHPVEVKPPAVLANLTDCAVSKFFAEVFHKSRHRAVSLCALVQRVRRVGRLSFPNNAQSRHASNSALRLAPK
jgi:hypothetical protein